MKAKKLNKRQKDLYAVCRRHRINYHQLSNDMKSVRVALEAEPFYQKPKRSKKIECAWKRKQRNRFVRFVKVK